MIFSSLKIKVFPFDFKYLVCFMCPRKNKRDFSHTDNTYINIPKLTLLQIDDRSTNLFTLCMQI